MLRLTPALALLAVLATSSAATEPPRTLIVGGDTGLREVSVDGTTVRVLSKTPASRPRLSTDGRSVFFLTKRGELRAVSLDDAVERTVATLPRSFTICKDVADYRKGHVVSIDQLAVQEDADLVIDRSGRALCVSLKDRNVNMLNVDVTVRVELPSGRVSHAMVFPDCGAPSPPPCEPPTSAIGVPAKRAYPYDLDARGRLVRHEGAGASTVVGVLGAGDFTVDQTSSSGRWVVVRGNESEGDYIHSDLFLLDRREGSVWPIRKSNVRALTKGQLSRIGKAKIETLDAVGESSIRWLTGVDLLLIDSLLVTPGVGAVELPGDVAR